MSTDRRIERTKAAIRDAIGSLLLEKPLNDISVTELADRANINRKTFYAHYSNVNDVIDEVYGEVVQAFSEMLKSMTVEYGYSPVDTFNRFLQILLENNDYASRLFLSYNGDMLMMKLQQAMSSALLESLCQMGSLLSISEDMYPVVADYISGGLVMTYYSYLRKSPKKSADELSALLSQIIINGFISLQV